MNKNYKIFQIHGLSGLVIVGFVLSGVFCGFFALPVWGIKAGWNEFLAGNFSLPVINYLQASLLWAIVVVSAYITLKNSITIKIHTLDNNVNELEINQLINNNDDTEMKENPSEGEN